LKEMKRLQIKIREEEAAKIAKAAETKPEEIKPEIKTEEK